MKKILLSAGILLASTPLLLASNFTEEQLDIYNTIKDVPFNEFNLSGLQASGFQITEADLNKQGQLRSLVVGSTGTSQGATSVIAVKDLFPGMSLHDATLLFNEVQNLSAGGSAPLGVHRKIDALLFAYFLDYKPQIFAKALTDMASPSSMGNSMVKNTMTGAMRKQFLRRPVTSGDWFSDLYAAFDVSYTDFEDTANNNSGKLNYQSVTFGGTLGEKTDLSFTISHDEANQKGASDVFARTWGTSFSLHHRLDDNYGIGVFGFYAQSEYRTIADEVDTFGGGVLATASWDLGEVARLSTAHSLSAGWTDFGQDTLYMGTVKLSRDWTDWLNTGAYAYYTDSLRTPKDSADSSYWTLGVDATFYLTEDLSLTLSYDSVEALKEYNQKTVFASLTWEF